MNLKLLLLLLPTIVCLLNSHVKIFAYAEDDTLEDDIVETDMDVDVEDGAIVGDEPDLEDDATDSSSTSSPHADTYLLFTKPLYVVGQQLDLPGGKPVEFLIGFTNKGQGEFIIETVEASFRYPMDFNYHIQNFSAVAYNREVKSGVEATISYSFLPSDQFAGRPFGLNIALNYRDNNGIQYSEAVFNETVLISEIDEGLDGETFFLYVLLAGIVVLLLVIGQQYLLGSSGKRKRSSAKKVIETGTANDSNIDYEWLPQETLRALQKSSPKPPKTPKTPKTSPKPVKQRQQQQHQHQPQVQPSPKSTQSPKQRKTVKQQ